VRDTLPDVYPCLCLQTACLPNNVSGVVIGLGDRALGHKARVNGPARTTTPTPRVITPQNRMRLTRSPHLLSQPKATLTSHSRQPQ